MIHLHTIVDLRDSVISRRGPDVARDRVGGLTLIQFELRSHQSIHATRDRYTMTGDQTVGRCFVSRVSQ